MLTRLLVTTDTASEYAYENAPPVTASNLPGAGILRSRGICQKAQPSSGRGHR